ncbi:hypothetical protein T440DRAFT_386046 [Plenodomus tracheiphilus IPT5]|uniref:Uncharacterized protein n=1 Tax=Plenodomus tracheiphilus IPT5 TaxID=1408161 RepID=A0A6A7BLU2_9PLEO|nr:hypothetical protein T440DRAFT_386046 [Plenodomus tracheiphilus IPT5]
MEANVAVKPEPLPTQDAETSRPDHKRTNSDETARPPSAQQRRDDTGDEQSDANSDAEPIDDGPAHRISDFDWDDLHSRYHAAINKCQDEENELMQEFESLMTYFRIWADSGHGHETSRTYHRLQTRSTYVRHSEEELETKRNHYINVVKAFESALNLLRAPGLGR